MKRPNVLIITCDCLRPDRLSGNGYRGVTTPTFDRIMDEGVTFVNAYCQSPNTWNSHAAFFTGCSPYMNGVRSPFGKISNQLSTMAEVFQQAGYDTFGLPALSLLSREAGFARGFTEYRLDGLLEQREEEARFRSCTDTLEITKTWLEQAGRPFFMWIHYYGIHWAPPKFLELPDEYRKSYSEYAQFYDGKVVYADEKFLAPLIDHLQTLGLLDETVLVLWSDHGDDLRGLELREQGKKEAEGGNEGHNRGLAEDVMRIFLVIRSPGLLPKGQRRTDICQSIDVLPTLFEMTELNSYPGQYEGRSLVSSLNQTDSQPTVIYENLPRGFAGVRYGRFKLVLTGHNIKVSEKSGRLASRVQLLKDSTWKLLPYRWQQVLRPSNQEIWQRMRGDPDQILKRLLVSGVCELYDLIADPDERNNIALDNPQLVLEYKNILREINTSSGRYQSSYTTTEEALIEERLKSLGYI